MSAPDHQLAAAANDGSALFETARGAVMFALNFSHGTFKKPAMVRMMGGGRRGRGLAGLDGAGQAGMIRAELERIGLHFEALLVARYAAPSTPCACRRPCCMGYVENTEWTDAIRVIAEYVLEEKATGTYSHHGLRIALVRRYFGVRQSFTDIAARCGIDRGTASDYFKRVAELLKRQEMLARFRIEEVLIQRGVVFS